jgi:multicomponent Na+:H+ antiporter subunit E
MQLAMKRAMRSVALFFNLALLWLFWSGYFTPALLFYGALSCLAVVAMSHRVRIVDPESLPFHLMPRGFVYIPWLLWEIVKSNIDVARIILDPKLPIRPELMRCRAPQRGEVAQVIYANSITLTPGTLTLDLANDEMLIHSLAPEFAEGVESGEMSRWVSWVEGSDLPAAGEEGTTA